MQNKPEKRGERGQAIFLVVLATSLFLLAGLGLAIDGAQLYGHRQMAQAAADGAAQAAAMSILGATNIGGNAFGSSAFNCAVGSDSRTPCVYAARNGFANSASDTIAVSFPASMPGVALSTITPAAVRVAITRRVPTTLMRFVGSTFTDVTAVGTAAIVRVFSPVPILVLHPFKSAALSLKGNPLVQICGGPQRSIQVNSSSTSAVDARGSLQVDLSRGGKNDTAGNCTTGTGSDMAVWGGPSSTGLPSWMTPAGTTEHYIQPAVPMRDPYASVPVPAKPPNAGAPTALGNGVSGCPASPKKPCKLYQPGNYPSGISVQNETAVFSPGIYYMDNGSDFVNHANGDMFMCTTCGVSADTGNAGMLVYLKARTSGAAGTIDIGANSDASLLGSAKGSVYKGLLFFQDRTANGATHTLGGGGSINLTGGIYLTNTGMTASKYQTLSLSGNSGNTTMIRGDIVVSVLELGGGGSIVMQLDPTAITFIDQVALVQ